MALVVSVPLNTMLADLDETRRSRLRRLLRDARRDPQPGRLNQLRLDEARGLLG
jgi:hypothetical protein